MLMYSTGQRVLRMLCVCSLCALRVMCVCVCFMCAMCLSAFHIGVLTFHMHVCHVSHGFALHMRCSVSRTCFTCMYPVFHMGLPCTCVAL